MKMSLQPSLSKSKNSTKPILSIDAEAASMLATTWRRSVRYSVVTCSEKLFGHVQPAVGVVVGDANPMPARRTVPVGATGRHRDLAERAGRR